jgi:hypothetical protein
MFMNKKAEVSLLRKVIIMLAVLLIILFAVVNATDFFEGEVEHHQKCNVETVLYEKGECRSTCLVEETVLGPKDCEEGFVCCAFPKEP